MEQSQTLFKNKNNTVVYLQPFRYQVSRGLVLIRKYQNKLKTRARVIWYRSCNNLGMWHVQYRTNPILSVPPFQSPAVAWRSYQKEVCVEQTPTLLVSVTPVLSPTTSLESTSAAAPRHIICSVVDTTTSSTSSGVRKRMTPWIKCKWNISSDLKQDNAYKIV